MQILNQIIQGLLLGGYYAMLASGLSFLFGVMRIVNLAHGSLVVLAAYLILIIVQHVTSNVVLAVALAIPPMALVGWIFNRVILQPSMRGGFLVPILATFGLSIVIDNLLFLRFGADTQSLAPNIGMLSYSSWNVVGNLYISQLDVLTFATALVLLGGLQLVLSRTGIGRAIRATAEDAEAIDLVGIDSRAVYTVATVISLTLITVAAAFMSMRATFTPYSGATQLIFAFETVVIGGQGSLWGTLLGGIVLGVAQSLGAEINPMGFLISGHAVFLVIMVLKVYRGHFRNLRLRTIAPTQSSGATA
jgi:branched-chain amino acid transport system permease protein